MNANHIVGHFFRMVESRATRSLSPNAYIVLLYLYRRFALAKDNPVLWEYEEAEIDLRTVRTAHRELIHHGFTKEGLLGEYLLINPETRSPLIYPQRKKRFEGIRTFWFPWFVLDYRRLNASELQVYACLWKEKNHRVYLTDAEIAANTGLSERTVKRRLQSLRKSQMIRCLTKNRAWFTKIKNKSSGLRNALALSDPVRIKPFGLTAVTRIRQITLCDPARPGVECTPRTFLQQWINFDEIREGDVHVLLNRLGVKILNDNGSVICCEIPGRPTNEIRKVDPQTGFSLIPSDKRNRKGRRKFIRQSIWELGQEYKGDESIPIVRRWHDDLIQRNAIQSVTATPTLQHRAIPMYSAEIENEITP